MLVLAFVLADHASEVQVTMMLTESCKLRGLHHRCVIITVLYSYILPHEILTIVVSFISVWLRTDLMSTSYG